VRDLVWSKADTVVFLDYPFLTVLGQLLRRTIRRSVTKTELWSGNRESIHKSFFSQDSILVWMLKTYSKNRRKYPALLQQPEYKHLSFVHLRSPKMASQWLMRY
jgi:hypothetical protein